MKSTLILILFLSSVSLANAQVLTLKEKQALAGLDFSSWESYIQEKYGTPVKITPVQTSFAGDIDAIWMIEQQAAKYVANAIAFLCDDNIAKEALVDKKISKIQIINYKEKGKKKVVITNGTLELHGSWGKGEDYLYEAEVKEAIENLL